MFCSFFVVLFLLFLFALVWSVPNRVTALKLEHLTECNDLKELIRLQVDKMKKQQRDEKVLEKQLEDLTAEHERLQLHCQRQENEIKKHKVLEQHHFRTEEWRSGKQQEARARLAAMTGHEGISFSRRSKVGVQVSKVAPNVSQNVEDKTKPTAMGRRCV